MKTFSNVSPTVDQVGVVERASRFTTRSIKKAAKVQGLKMVLSMIDLTTLEGMDTPGKVRQLCYKARHLHDELPDIPNVAAVCVYPNFVKLAKTELADSSIKVASVATAFPSGNSSLEIKLDDVRLAVEGGADEIDMVINIGALKSYDYALVAEDIVKVVDAAQGRLVKVIIETALLTDEQKRMACAIAAASEADFVKTSTGFSTGGATVEDVALMREVVGPFMGVKASGGVRTYEDALAMLDAGATRLGCSSSIAIVTDQTTDDGSDY